MTTRNAMGFFHNDGLPAAWHHAMKFAGEGGRIATLPEVIWARMRAKPGDAIWENYFTTLTAEYYGIGKDGKHKLIVAHGIGPMSTLDGIMKAYSWQYKDKQHRRHGGRITAQEFLRLEAGEYGKVESVDIQDYFLSRQYPFIDILNLAMAKCDPVLHARFGKQTDKYLEYHAAICRKWHAEMSDAKRENKHGVSEEQHQDFVKRMKKMHTKNAAKYSNPYMLQIGECDNLYLAGERGHLDLSRHAVAHLVSVGQLTCLCYKDDESLTVDTSGHGWHEGTRFLALRPGYNMNTDIVSLCPSEQEILKANWEELFVSCTQPEAMGFSVLIKLGDTWFTQVPKQGSAPDTYDAEYRVTQMSKIGEPVRFRTETDRYHCFDYLVEDVKRLAPPRANAYMIVSNPKFENGTKFQTCMVQFCKVEIDTSQRLLTSEELSRDYDRMMALA